MRVERGLEAAHHLGGLRRMAAGPDVEVDVGSRQAEVGEQAAAHVLVVVLAGVDQQRRQRRHVTGQRTQDRRHLHEVRPRADDAHHGPQRAARSPVAHLLSSSDVVLTALDQLLQQGQGLQVQTLEPEHASLQPLQLVEALLGDRASRAGAPCPGRPPAPARSSTDRRRSVTPGAGGLQPPGVRPASLRHRRFLGEFAHHFVDVGAAQVRLLGEEAQQQQPVADRIDAPRDAAGRLEDRVEGRRLEARLARATRRT